MLLRRFVVTALSLAVVCATIPAPSYAGISTTSEVQLGKETDKQVTDSTNVVTDPLLNAWVGEVTQRLWTQIARKDVPYNIKILDVEDVNAFTTLGGYVYVNEGTLDFTQSDDELAGVLGHETGHDERRHAITANNKANIMNAILTVGSLLNPFVYRFGQFIQAGYMAKVSRADELEADKYGVMLMSRAGYDPDAMVSFMKHLGAVYADHNSLLDKYIADHPGVPDRVSHLQGYAELDPLVRTDAQRRAAAEHNLETARYAIAAREFSGLVRAHPDDTSSMYHLGEAQLALGQTSKGEQNLAAAASSGAPQTRTLALGRIASLRDTEKRLSILHPNLQPLRDAMAAAQTNETTAATAIASRRDAGRDQLKAMQTRLQDITFEIPNYSRIQPRKNGRLETVLRNLTTMGRALDTAIQKAQQSIGGVGSLELHKEGGLIKENADILAEMNAPLALAAPPPQALGTFAYYPRMLDGVSAADGDMIRSVDAARASLALLDIGLGDLDRFVRQLVRTQIDMSGDISPGDYKLLEVTMKSTNDELNRAAVAAAQGSQLFNMARARQLQTRIDMLGLAAAADRYATLQHAVDLRFHNDPLSYDEMLKTNLSPGEITASCVIAADTNVAPAVIVQQAQSQHRSLVDVANERGMHAEALEIFLGLVYLDYTDDPDKEARGRT